MEKDDGILTPITISTFSSLPGVGNFGFSTFALCLNIDAEKETHKHKLLWKNAGKLRAGDAIILKMSLCTSNQFRELNFQFSRGGICRGNFSRRGR